MIGIGTRALDAVNKVSGDNGVRIKAGDKQFQLHATDGRVSITYNQQTTWEQDKACFSLSRYDSDLLARIGGEDGALRLEVKGREVTAHSYTSGGKTKPTEVTCQASEGYPSVREISDDGVQLLVDVDALCLLLRAQRQIANERGVRPTATLYVTAEGITVTNNGTEGGVIVGICPAITSPSDPPTEALVGEGSLI